MRRLTLLLENNPYSEKVGGSKYPSLRFYLGTYKLMADSLGIKDIDIICMNKAKNQVNVDDRNDIGILMKLGYRFRVLPFDTEEPIDILVAGIMQYRPTWQYELLDKLASRCSRLIYLDSDHEPEVTATSMFRSLRELDLKNVASKLSDVIYSEGTSNGFSWLNHPSLVGNDLNVDFLPWITHPWYLLDDNKFKEINSDPKYHISMMRGPESDRIRKPMENYRINDIVPPGLFSKRLMSVDDINSALSESVVFLGTMLTNSGSGGRFRSTSKIMESLNAGALPTVMKLDDPSSILYDRYPYYELIPNELKVLVRESKASPTDIEVLCRYAKMLESDLGVRKDIHGLLYDAVYEYHHPSRWMTRMERILSRE